MDKRLTHLVSCGVCRQAFATVIALGRHVDHHVVKKAVELSQGKMCYFRNGQRGCCAKGEESTEDLFVHVRRHHLIQGLYVCEACGTATDSFVAFIM